MRPLVGFSDDLDDQGLNIAKVSEPNTAEITPMRLYAFELLR
jgi:hypothetical protein